MIIEGQTALLIKQLEYKVNLASILVDQCLHLLMMRMFIQLIVALGSLQLVDLTLI